MKTRKKEFDISKLTDVDVGKLRHMLTLYCPAGFKYNPYVNRVYCISHPTDVVKVPHRLMSKAWKNVSEQMVALFNHHFSDDHGYLGISARCRRDSNGQVCFEFDGCESFGLLDLVEMFREFCGTDVMAVDGNPNDGGSWWR